MNFFNSIIDFIEKAWQFLLNLINSLLTATSIISYLPSFSVTLAGFVPPFIGSCILAVVAIGVIKLIVGWGNG